MGQQRDGAIQELRAVAFGEDAEIGRLAAVSASMASTAWGL